jgi:hypothetical protein
LRYSGGFRKNTFHGRGEEQGTDHKFKGEYSNGHKASGSLIWYQGDEQYSYEGTFNEEGQFHGKGRLLEPTGTYEGEFEDGFKHGQGIYRYTNKLRYEGDYHYNKREGTGRLFDSNNRLAYEGEFKNGLPHGKGHIPDGNGEMQASTWIEGID